MKCLKSKVVAANLIKQKMQFLVGMSCVLLKTPKNIFAYSKINSLHVYTLIEINNLQTFTKFLVNQGT